MDETASQDDKPPENLLPYYEQYAKKVPEKPFMLQTLEEAHALNTTIQEVTDKEWKRRLQEWENERANWMTEMVQNCVWSVGSEVVKDRGAHDLLTPQQILTKLGPRNLFGLDPSFLRGGDARAPSTAHIHGHAHHKSHSQARRSQHQSRAQIHEGKRSQHHVNKQIGLHAPAKSSTEEQQQQHRLFKHKKMSRLELLKFLNEWDKVSYGKRDKLLMDFIKFYRSKDNIYDSDALFHCGGSLIFGRFTISMQMSFLKHRVVWHYFDALAIFVKSLQGDKYTEEFLRLGGLGFICEIIRVEVSSQADKLHACKFLVDMMKGRNSIAVKQFICDNPHFLESLVDSLTMCKDKKLVAYCGQCFENLCIEATMANVLIVSSYIMRLLPCDFNPIIQSMAFRVLQCVIRLIPTHAAKCVRFILDNLKTEDMDLLVEMSNLSLVILQTKSGPELIGALMVVAEGVQLREQFKSTFRPHMRKARDRDKHTKEHALELRKAREKHERVKQKMAKFDLFMIQAGALFVVNRMMTNKTEYVNEFTRQGIFGLSLKTLGSCPHWEVQGQGVTMVQFLHAMSVECAISYFLMLPQKMIQLLLERPAECLRFFTSPICIHLRKLGRFALRHWERWVQKVVIPAQKLSEDGILPDDFFEMSKMARKVAEIQRAISDLLDRPVMESYSRTPEVSSTTLAVTITLPLDEDSEDIKIAREFLTDDEQEQMQHRSGKDLIHKDKHFKPFLEFMDFNATLSDDKLDTKVDKFTTGGILPGSVSKNNELSALEQTLLQDATENKPATAEPSNKKPPSEGPSGAESPEEGESPRGEIMELNDRPAEEDKHAETDKPAS